MKEQIGEMAKDLQKSEHWYFDEKSVDFELDHRKTAENLYNAGYRKQSEVIDDFVKRLLDAFPEANRDNRCPSIYFDDYVYIIEELAEEMKEGAE